uniref:Uncharacterized protein n=1 Tax=Romanomermis culicivorax TaxID=13658 RepID=A0A915L1W1_ROMCU
MSSLTIGIFLMSSPRAALIIKQFENSPEQSCWSLYIILEFQLIMSTKSGKRITNITFAQEPEDDVEPNSKGNKVLLISEIGEVIEDKFVAAVYESHWS